MNEKQIREILDDIFEVVVKSPDYSVLWDYMPDSFKELEQEERITMWGYMCRYGIIEDENIFNGGFKQYKLNKEWIGFAESGGWRAIRESARKAEVEKEKAEMRAQSALREAKKANWIALIVGICTLFSFLYQTIHMIRMDADSLPNINVAVSFTDDIKDVVCGELICGKDAYLTADTINMFIFNRSEKKLSDTLVQVMIRLKGDSTISFRDGDGRK